MAHQGKPRDDARRDGRKGRKVADYHLIGGGTYRLTMTIQDPNALRARDVILRQRNLEVGDLDLLYGDEAKIIADAINQEARSNRQKPLPKTNRRTQR